ncbi:metal ABC transporter permease [bacterium]|nr:metal ABC transporter permease [bacterium]
MIEALSYPFMWWALAACLVLAGIHAYLGFHVVKRGVIFVDLSMAQFAALGMAIAIVADAHESAVASYLFPVGATLVGAVLFAWLRNLEHRVSLEAFIGIAFASAQALVLLILERTPSGAEHLKETLVGTIFTVSPDTVIRTAIIYAIVGVIHFLIRKPLFDITDYPEQAKMTRNVFVWDVVFYATFGVVVTSSVKIAGVLLVFALLVIPSVAGVLVSNRTSIRLLVGWSFGFVCSTFGLLAAFAYDTPAAPTILTMLTLALIVHGAIVWGVRRGRNTPHPPAPFLTKDRLP